MLKNDLSITRLEPNLDAKIERHFDTLDTLMIYDDNRGRDQQDITEMLDGMF